MLREKIKNQIIEKVEKDYRSYIDELEKSSKSRLISQAYEIACHHSVYDGLSNGLVDYIDECSDMSLAKAILNDDGNLIVGCVDFYLSHSSYYDEDGEDIELANCEPSQVCVVLNDMFDALSYNDDRD